MAAILSKRLIVLFLVAAAFLTASAGICYRAVRTLNENQRLVTHTHEVLGMLETTRGALAAAEGDQRNFLLTGHDDYLARYRSAARRAGDSVDLLARLTADNAGQQSRVEALRAAVNDRVRLLEDGVGNYRSGGMDAARTWVLRGLGRQAMDRALTLVEQMDAEEGRLLGVRSDQSAKGLRRMVVTFALVGLFSVALLGMIIFSVRREVAVRLEAARELKASEGRLLMAVEAAELGIWEHDLVADRIMSSDRCQAMFGLPPGERVTMESALARIVPEDRDHLVALIRKATEPGGRGEYVVEYRVTWPDGTVRNIRARGRAIFEGAGATRRAVRIVGTLLDLTDLHAVEKELREARDRAEAANRTKDQFLAVLSHELRTPLTPVLAAVSDMERRGEVPDGLRADVAMIRRNVEMEARLIDDLLDLTRIARGKIRLHPEVVDVHALVEAVLEMFRGEAEAKGLAVVTELSAARHHVWGDPARLQQVLWNLVSNSVKFTPAHGRVVVRTPASDDAKVSVEVSDTGIGIDAQAIPRLFNAFEQGEQTITRKFGGLGLGLSIAKAIVELHGGTLEAQSAGRDRGTTFVMRLKAAAVPEKATENGPTPSPAAGRSDGPRKLRILLVEDNEDTRRLMGRLLRTFGHQVESADSVGAATDLAGRERFDLLVSDIGLPDGTGWELMERLGDRRPPKAIALSGFGMEEDLRRSREVGFLEHMIKPVNIVALRETIERVAGNGAGA